MPIEKQTSLINLTPLNWFNILTAWSVAKKIFKKEAMDILICYSGSLLPRWLWPKINRDTISDLNYFIAMKDNQPVGITGLYTTHNQPEEVWLAWFGLNEKLRGRGLGKEIMVATIDMARKHGYQSLRLWTTANEEPFIVANYLYQKLGFIAQETDLKSYGFPVLIYSLGLSGITPPLYKADMTTTIGGTDSNTKSHNSIFRILFRLYCKQ
ncbi:MAG: GNAT family N-acetyltransferase [Chlorobiaceae bacterium]